MTQSLTHQQMGTAARGQAHALFAQTMVYVAATTALFALGAWLGRNLTAVARAVADDGVATRKPDDLVHAVQDAIWQPAYPDPVS